jgi:N-dimethylarginine dimethylaminohydrolase
MGDPTYFSVKGGANPHTRTRWGTRRIVDRAVAISQWKRLHDVLRDLGVRVLVVPPNAEQPGLVYPANAGFLTHVDAALPLRQKTFYLSNLLPTRAGERAHYEKMLQAHGFRTERLDEHLRFEGEADFFPVGDLYFLTYGRVERQRFQPAFAIPPWRRVYGFRTSANVEPMLSSIISPRPVIRAELVLEAHYHGDTALCAFGPGREYLLAYSDALEPRSWDRVRRAIGERILELEQSDAVHYAANSFTLSQRGESFLVMPAGVSDRLLAQVRECGVTPVVVDVSEFLKKGGGSVKCMIGDLGPIAEGDLIGTS